MRVHNATNQTPLKMLQAERAKLLPLPVNRPLCAITRPVKADSRCRIWFDSNSYSVPSKYAGQSLNLQAETDKIKLYSSALLIASHVRCYGRKNDIVNPDHQQELKEPYGNLLHFGHATPVIFNDILITGSRSGELLGIELNNGKVKYKKQCSSTFIADLTINNDILQIAFADGVVGEWSALTFENYWTFKLLKHESLGLLAYVRAGVQGLIAPLRYKNHRLAFDLIDTIFLLDEHGKPLDQYKLNSPVVTPPVIKANKLWVSCLNGRIAHFELKV